MRGVSPTLRLLRAAALLAAALLACAPALAGGPRWTAGVPYFQNPDGRSVIWYTQQPQYFTDPGDLSPSVSHAAADTLVANAAAVWNIPVSGLVLAQGGALAEHVSGANVYLGPSGPVFPADVQASNGPARQIAVIYDSDGSVTDTLLGGGASAPGNCRQSAVTESVDGISPAAQITHALLILNGRCTGPAPELQLEMQYRLARAFGRILGIGWAQVNDNVFTGFPIATYLQAANWPLMHPIDILCGPYAFQCIVQPFTLKPDDIASVASLYPVNAPAPGKTPTYANATYIYGVISFSNGQGMAGVNVVSRVRHQRTNYTDPFESTSSVSGYEFLRNNGNPVTPRGAGLNASFGSPYVSPGGFYLAWIPAPTFDYWDDITITTQPVNPLYTGQYAIGPYQGAQVSPSGPMLTAEDTFIGPFNYAYFPITATQGAGPCVNADGAESAPIPVPATGLWSSTLCGYGHTAWSSLAIRANRSLAVEVTALDEQGLATTAKLNPVLGIWNATDPTGAAPTLAAQAAALNASTLGLTTLAFASATARTLRLGMGDVRGDGRPDFAYSARVLYADTVSPATLPANGGQITLSGMGFRTGNAVSVNGAPATVLSWSANTIVAIAPPLTGPLTADITVTDLSTHGQTILSGALAYTATTLPDHLAVVSSPADGAQVGSPASPAFSVRFLLPDGLAPAAGVSLTLSATGATLGLCNATSACTVQTDANGLVTTPVTPTTAGSVTLQASAGALSVSASFLALAIPTDILHVVTLPSGSVFAGLPAAAPFTVQVLLPDGVTPDAGAHVALAALNATLAACSGLPACTLIADPSGTIATALTPTAPGAVNLQASSNGGLVSASFGAIILPPDILHILSLPANGSYVGRLAAPAFTVQVFLGDGITPAAGIPVTLTSPGAALGACNAHTCTVLADASGLVSTTLVPAAPGAISLSATAGASFIAAGFTAVVVPPDTLQVLSVPTQGAFAGSPAALPFTVHVLFGDTGLPAPNLTVSVSASNAILGACHAAGCAMTTDASGNITTAVTPIAPGRVTLTASAGGGSVSASFNAVAVPVDILRVLTQPSGSVYTSLPAATPFSVQVTLPDGQTLAAGAAVTLTAANATLAACSGATTCILPANNSGIVTTQLTPLTPGLVTLTASAGGGIVSTTFGVLLLPSDMVRIVSIPAGIVYAGQVAATRFIVQVMLGDGITPAIAVPVTLTASNATLTACTAAPCVLPADPNGDVSTTLTPTAPGRVTLTATAAGIFVTAFFNVIAVPPDILRIQSAPANGSFVGQPTAAPFTVQVLLPDATTPAAGTPLILSAVGATLAACAGASACTLTTDPSGTLSTAVTPTAAGRVTLSASAGSGTASTTFNAVILPPNVLHLLSAPANGAFVASPAPVPFRFQVFLPDGITPAAAAAVTLAGSNAILGACGSPACTVTAGPQGIVTTTVTPQAPGLVSLQAASAGGSLTSAFTAILRPDTLQILSAPSGSVYTGFMAGSRFAVQVLLGDGAPAPAGVPVTFTANAATFTACTGNPCTLPTDALGQVSSSLTPTAAGAVILTATAGGGAVTTTFTATDPILGLTLARTTEYVATGASVPWLLTASVFENGQPAAATIAWTASTPGLTLAAPTSPSDASGNASLQVTAGPLASGATASGQACAQISDQISDQTPTCAPFSAQAVDPPAWRLVVLSGAIQTVNATATLQPVVARAVDTAGHWIAGVPVAIHQAVNGWVACPATGRCPVGPGLATATATILSDQDGLITLTPLELPNTPATTQIVLAAGPNGDTTLTLSKTP